MRFGLQQCLFAIAVLSASAAGAEERLFQSGYAMPSADDVAGLERAQVTRAYVPEAIDLSPKLPKPGQQQAGSCVAWAAAYAARSYYEIDEAQGAPANDDLIASPAYLYNHIRFDNAPCETAGSNILLAIAYLKGFGLPSLKEVGSDQTCKPLSTPPQSYRRFSIKSFKLLAFALPDDPKLSIAPNIDLFKQQLAKGNPIIFGMNISQSFEGLAGPEVYPKPGTDPGQDLGGHAMTMVGYDDRRRAFRVINSWGETWADGGYAWISYDHIRSHLRDAYTLDVGRPPAKPVPSRAPVSGKGLANFECGDVRMSKEGGKGVLVGFVGKPEDLKAAEAAARETGVRNAVELRPYPLCNALIELADPLAAPSVPVIETIDGKSEYRNGDTLGIRVKAPDFPSYLYLVYLAKDGSVVNLLPRKGRLRQQVAPGTELLFGDGKEGRPRFRIGGPAGDEAMVLIASRSPVAELEALEAKGGLFDAKAAKAPGASPGDVAFFDALRKGRIYRPDATALQREMAAAVLHVKITGDGNNGQSSSGKTKAVVSLVRPFARASGSSGVSGAGSGD